MRVFHSIAFNTLSKVGGVDVYLIPNGQKFYRDGKLIDVGRTGIFVGNMGNKIPTTSRLHVAARIMDINGYGELTIVEDEMDIGAGAGAGKRKRESMF